MERVVGVEMGWAFFICVCVWDRGCVTMIITGR